VFIRYAVRSLVRYFVSSLRLSFSMYFFMYPLICLGIAFFSYVFISLCRYLVMVGFVSCVSFQFVSFRCVSFFLALCIGLCRSLFREFVRWFRYLFIYCVVCCFVRSFVRSFVIY